MLENHVLNPLRIEYLRLKIQKHSNRQKIRAYEHKNS